MDGLIKLFKSLYNIICTVVSGFARLLFGKNDKLEKKLPLFAALAFLSVCVYQSLHALAVAEREAAKTK